MNKIIRGVEIRTDHVIQARRRKIEVIKKKMISCLVDFVFPLNHIVYIKKNENRDKYLNLTLKLKTLRNKLVMLI